MANYGQVSYGSKGSDVTELQKLLNNNGYNLSVDGDFGSKTQAAVKDYQQKNGLSVDGIVGTNTWGALTKANTTQTTTTPTDTTPKYEAYTPSDTVLQAEAMLKEQMASKPGAYQSTWQNQLQEIIQQIQNGEKFSYDLNGDALYQQYKDQYTTQGKLAMMDTMGKAAAMTGGYGNSYAQSVGQQAYQGYLQKLNDVVPELYQLARSQFDTERQGLYDQASLIAGMEDQDYGRYRDKVSDYYTELGLLQEDARYKAEDEYGKWMDKTNLDYQIGRDTVEDEWRQKEFDEAVRQYNEQMALSKSKSTSSSLKKVVDEDEEDDPVVTPTETANTKSFLAKYHTENQHDTIARKMYGSYRNYVDNVVAPAIEAAHKKGTLDDGEALFLMMKYGIMSDK